MKSEPPPSSLLTLTKDSHHAKTFQNITSFNPPKIVGGRSYCSFPLHRLLNWLGEGPPLAPDLQPVRDTARNPKQLCSTPKLMLRNLVTDTLRSLWTLFWEWSLWLARIWKAPTGRREMSFQRNLRERTENITRQGKTSKSKNVTNVHLSLHRPGFRHRNDEPTCGPYLPGTQSLAGGRALPGSWENVSLRQNLVLRLWPSCQLPSFTPEPRTAGVSLYQRAWHCSKSIYKVSCWFLHYSSALKWFFPKSMLLAK